MAELTLNVEIRTETGKGAGRRLRRRGKVPAVLYGKSLGSIALQVDASALQKLLQAHGAGGLIELRFDGRTQVALIKEVQTDPVLGTPQHVDFHAVSLDQAVQVAVPIVLTGEDARPSDGGIVTPVMRELPVSCLPTQIPESVSVDISGLSVGESITAGAVPLPAGVRLATKEDEVVVAVVAPAREPRTDEAAPGGEAEEASAASKAEGAGDGNGSGEEARA